MKPTTESALEMCGRDRVMHREHPPAVAVRATTLEEIVDRFKAAGVVLPHRFVTGEGSTLDAAGVAAAKAYAAHLVEVACALEKMAGSLKAQAKEIEMRLEGGK